MPGISGPTTVQLPQLEEDPPWPHLVVESHEFWEDSPFWGERPGGSRWHRLIPTVPVEIAEGWNASDVDKARAWLVDQIHVDLLSRSVLAGSCHLRLPNPLYRRLTRRVDDSWRAIEFRLTPYAGVDLATLELTHWNRRGPGERRPFCACRWGRGPRRGHALPRLADDESQRRAAELWGQLRVRWFDEDAKAGRQAVRDIIRGATKLPGQDLGEGAVLRGACLGPRGSAGSRSRVASSVGRAVRAGSGASTLRTHESGGAVAERAPDPSRVGTTPNEDNPRPTEVLHRDSRQHSRADGLRPAACESDSAAVRRRGVSPPARLGPLSTGITGPPGPRLTRA